MKCKPWIRHFSPPKFQCFSSQFALHGLRALEEKKEKSANPIYTNPAKNRRRKVGFPPTPERAPESLHFLHTFCTKRVQKVPLCTNCGALSGIGRSPTFFRRLLIFRMACLQNVLSTKVFFESLIFSRKMLRNFPEIFEQSQRKTKEGKTQGRGKHNIKPFPKNGFGPPHLWYDLPPPPFCSRNVILLRGNGHRPDKSHFLRPPKLGLEGALYSTFSPSKIARHVWHPPPLRISYFVGLKDSRHNFHWIFLRKSKKIDRQASAGARNGFAFWALWLLFPINTNTDKNDTSTWTFLANIGRGLHRARLWCEALMPQGPCHTTNTTIIPLGTLGLHFINLFSGNYFS